MKSSKLLLRLKKRIKPYESKVKPNIDCLTGNDVSIQCTMSKYNLKNFHEILNSYPEGLNHEVDEGELRDLEYRVDNYFRIHAPDDEEFKEFIKLISVYLTFIAKKPLHPPGIEFQDGTRVYEEGNIYYCTGKSLHLNEEYSLCRCCVATNPP